MLGQLTNFDKLEVVMETDGSVSGEEATDIASHILVDHFSMMFSGGFAKIEGPSAEAAEPMTEVTEEMAEEPAGENEIQAFRTFYPRQERFGKKRHYLYV